MRVFIVSCAVAAVIAIGAYVTLNFYQELAAVAYSTSSVRI